MFATTVLLAATLTAAQPQPVEPGVGQSDHHGMVEKCAKACADCMVLCDMCARHCVEQVAKGKADHKATAGFCADCADVCAAAGKVVARDGPLVDQICEACAKSCEQCAKACEAHPESAEMKRCAKACRDCAKACRAMLAHAGR